MRVYLWKEDIERNDPVMVVEYKSVGSRKKYDIQYDSEKYELFIDGKVY